MVNHVKFRAHLQLLFFLMRVAASVASNASLNAISYHLGESIPGSMQYSTSALANDGRIFAIPFNADKVLVIDPSRNTSYELDESYLGIKQWNTSTVALDGRIFAPPCSSQRVLVVDPKYNSSYLLPKSYEGSHLYVTSILGQDGRIFAAPYKAAWVLVIDPPANRSYRLPELYASEEYFTSVMADDGRIFAPPLSYCRVLVIDPAANTSYPISTAWNNHDMYKTATLARDGRIFAPPYQESKVLVIEPFRNHTYQLNITISGSFLTSVLSGDGRIFAAPAAGSKVLVIDPSRDTAIELDQIYNGNVMKYETSVLGPDGRIFAPPFSDANHVLVMDPMLNTSYQLNENYTGLTKFSTVVVARNNILYAAPSGGAGKVLAIVSTTTTSPTSSPTSTPTSAAPTRTPTVQGSGPSALSAQFSRTYQLARVTFNAATNQPAAEECSTFFNDSSAALLGSGNRCYWEDAFVLVVVMGTGFSLSPGDSLGLPGGTVASASNSNQLSPYSEVTVSRATSTTPVSVVLSGEATIGTCGGIIEITANAQGSLSRPFIYNWTVINSTGMEWESELGDLAREASSNIFFLNGTKIPFGENVTVAVSVTNWLNDSASSQRKVSKVNAVLPSLRLATSTNITVRRSRATELNVQARTPDCLNNLRIDSFWRQIAGPNHVSLSNSRASYANIPALSLEPLSLYQWQYTANVVQMSTNATLGQQSVVFTLNVENEPLQASIKGGSTRSVPIVPGAAAYTISIDASLSTDPAYPYSPEALMFSWSLYDTSTNIESSLTSNDAVLSLSTSQLAADRLYLVRVNITSNRTLSANATASQYLLTSSLPVPKVSVDASSPEGVQAISQKLVLSAKAVRADSSSSADDDASLALSWACDSSDLNITDRSKLRSAIDARTLIVAPDVLIAGRTYTFSVQASVQSGAVVATGSASVTIRTNAPPSAGSCSSSPASGVAFETEFILSCEGYVDDAEDLPLRYKFQLVQVNNGESGLTSQTLASPSTTFLDICRFRELQSYKTKLAGSTSSSDERVFVRAIVSDNIGAEAYSHFHVNVTQSAATNLTEINAVLEQYLDQGDTQSFVVEIAAVASFLSSSVGVSQTTTSLAGEEREALLRKASQVVQTPDDQSSSSTLSYLVVATITETLTGASRADEITGDVVDTTLDIIGRITESYAESSFLNGDELKTVTAASGAISNILTAANTTANASASGLTSKRTHRVLSNLTTMLASGLIPGEDEVVVGRAFSSDKVAVSVATRLMPVDETTNVTLSSLGGALVGLDLISVGSADGATSMQLGYVAVAGGRGGSLYPFAENITSAYTSGLAVVEIKALMGVGNAVAIEVADRTNTPFRIQIPSDADGDALPANGVETVAFRQCVFWDEVSESWSAEGVAYKGLNANGHHVCDSTHLTTFSTRPAFQVQVNTVSASDVKSTDAYDPAKSPTMALTLVLIGAILALFTVAVFHDRRTSSTPEAIKENGHEFHRSMNMSRKLHLEDPRSSSNWNRSMSLAIRRRHPWFSTFIRMHGDYLDSKKRVLILALLIFNAAAVCALLVGTEQKLGYVQGNVAIAIVAMAIGFPLPYVVTTMFTRDTPDAFKITFEPAGFVKVMPWLFWAVTLLMGELETDFGLAIEDEDDAGAEDGDADDANQNRVDEGEGDEDEDRKKAKNEAAAAAIGALAGGTTGHASGLSSNESKGNKYKRVRSIKAFKTNLNINTSAQSVGVESTRNSAHQLKHAEAMENCDNARSEAKSEQRLFVLTESSKRSSHRKLATEKKTKPITCCGRLIMNEPVNPSYEEWVFTDFIGAAICIIAVIGCAFLVVVFAHQTAQREGADWSIMVASLLTLPQDIGARLCTILWLEAVLTGPWFYVLFPCCMLCGLCASDGDDARVADCGHTYRFDVDQGVCTLNEQNFVRRTYPQAEEAGVRSGWRLVRVNDVPVETKADSIRELRRVHALQRYFYATFDSSATARRKASEKPQLSAAAESSNAIQSPSRENAL